VWEDEALEPDRVGEGIDDLREEDGLVGSVRCADLVLVAGVFDGDIVEEPE